VTLEVPAMWMLHMFVLCVAPLHLTSECDAQTGNEVTSLEGAVFPAGLTKLDLVSMSFGCCRS
jgi:hypothetical protein